jgi:hypothetical protein
MSLAISRISTRTGMRIHFDGYPESSKPPQFCEGHPMAERDHALSATFLLAPFGAMVPLRWRVNGVMQDMPPKPGLIEVDEDEDAEEAV